MAAAVPDRRKPPTGKHAEYRKIGNEPAPASCRTCVHWYRSHGACAALGVLYVRRKGDNCVKYEEGKNEMTKSYDAAIDKVFAATVKPPIGPEPRRIRENCHNCLYGGVYECRRHAPVAGNDASQKPVFPSIYNQGMGTWCGDWEEKKEPAT